MARTIGIGKQDFEKVRINNNFYVDKTDFIRQWWETDDDVTLIMRPRRFGKTLNMSMLEKFFSVKYAGRSDLFQGLSIWNEEKYRQLQGTYPVLFISFADVKETSYPQTRKKICGIIRQLYDRYLFLLDGDLLGENEKKDFRNVSTTMQDYEASGSVRALSDYLCRYYGKKVIILLDEYDTPMQEAYVNGYWEEMTSFVRGLFNSTFKTNPYLERAVLTGITRVSKESIFSDFNNPEVVTTTSKKYADCFGFTEKEVFEALEEYGLSDRKGLVKNWYDGFTFGERTDIYNPWSIINFLSKGEVGTYWANTSSNSLAGKVLRAGDPGIKQSFERLMCGESIRVRIDEQIVYDQLSTKRDSIWSFLLASGYLKVAGITFEEETGRKYYDLMLTNREVRLMFEDMIHDWFSQDHSCNEFIRTLLLGDLKAMNTYMNRMALTTFSYFDTGKNPSGVEPERFYHGFVLGLMVELSDRYVITSNRESGFGRYDIMLEPRTPENHGLSGSNTPLDAIIIEFKVQDSDERELADTVREALRQIDEKGYQANLIARGIPQERIRKYGFAFCGKEVLIGSDREGGIP